MASYTDSASGIDVACGLSIVTLRALKMVGVSWRGG